MRRLIIGIVMAMCVGNLQAQDVFTTNGTQLTDATGQPFITHLPMPVQQ